MQLLAKNAFFGHFGVFQAAFGPVSFNLVENAFVTQQLAILATSMAFYEILAWHALKSKF